MNKTTLILALSVVILGFSLWRIVPLILNRETGPAVITYWDFWEENSISPLLREFESLHPNIKIVYNFQSQLNYRNRVQTQIKEGGGPDVFPTHNSWLPMFSADLAPAPLTLFNALDFKKTFYPVVADSFLVSNQVLAAPLGIDGLALFYNEDILIAGGVAIPKSWSDFTAAANKLTVKDAEGNIKTAGAGLGTTGNVDYWSDLLGMMLLQQPGVDLRSPTSEQTEQVLRFYTGFVTDPTKKVWDVNLPSSTVAFEEGILAFYFGPYSKVAEIKAANPNLKFKVAPVPQLPGRQIAWGSFWGEAVSGKSKRQNESWELIKFLTSKDIAKSFAKPYARVDLANLQLSDPELGAFVAQGPYYKFWYLATEGEDNGINDEMIKVWETGVNGFLQGKSSQEVLQNISTGVKGVLDKYHVK